MNGDLPCREDYRGKRSRNISDEGIKWEKEGLFKIVDESNVFFIDF